MAYQSVYHDALDIPQQRDSMGLKITLSSQNSFEDILYGQFIFHTKDRKYFGERWAAGRIRVPTLLHETSIPPTPAAVRLDGGSQWVLRCTNGLEEGDSGPAMECIRLLVTE